MTFIPSIRAIQPNLTGICSSRGVEINNEAGINPADDLEKLNDVSGLLKIQDILEKLDSQLSVVQRFSQETAIRLSNLIASAQGETAFDKYINALVLMCGNEQCINASAADQPRALARLTHLRAAQAQMKGLAVSKASLDRLIALESKQSGVGVAKTKAAVVALIAELASELKLADADQNETRIDQLIKAGCQAGVKQAPPIVPPPVVPVVQPKATQEQVSPSPFYLGLALLPGYGVKVSGESTAPLQFGPALRGDIAVGYTVSDKTRLQLDYLPFINVSNGFNSRLSQDAGTLSVAHRLPKLTLVGQGGFLWNRNTIDGRGAFKDDYEGTAGAGVMLFNGLLYPFAGGLFGSSFGGYGGLRSAYEHEPSRLGISATALFSHLKNNQAGGSLAGTYKIKVLGTDLRVGVSAGGDYDATNKAADVRFGLVVRLGGNNVIMPQPMTLGSAF